MARKQRRDEQAAMKVSQALQLRAKRLSYDKIARMVGYADRRTAQRAVQRELDRVVPKDRDLLLAEELATLDVLQSQVYDLVMDPSYEWRLFALDRMLAIMDLRAKLMGLYAPSGGTAVAQVTVVVREVLSRNRRNIGNDFSQDVT